MKERKKQNLTECVKCRDVFDSNLQVCPDCNPEFRETAAKRRLPLIIYPIFLMFGLYLFWELLKRFSASP